MSAPKMLDDEVETDAILVRRLLESQHPQWARLPIARVPSSGTVNAIYRVGADLCVRLPRVERFAGDLLKEQVWLPKLASQLPVVIPEVLARGTPGEGYPFHWAVYRWLPGETWNTDHVTDLCQAAADLAHFIAALQAIDATDGPRPYRGGCGSPLAEKDRDVRAAIETLRDAVDADALVTAWDAVGDAGEWSGRPLLVHGDLRPPNLLIAGGSLSAVIDFGGLSAGDPACDLAPAWTLFKGESRELFRAALPLDAATWMRGRGWALARVIDIAYYKTTNPEMVTEAQHTLEQVLTDH